VRYGDSGAWKIDTFTRLMNDKQDIGDAAVGEE
jgi:hypothetical protein